MYFGSSLKHYSALLICSFACQFCLANESLIIKHYQSHSRYQFGIDVLKLALTKTNTPYKLATPFEDKLNEARGEKLVISGDLDLQFMITTLDRETKMIPIKFPIYRGLLGMRLLLIHKNNMGKFTNVNSLSQLQELVAGHGQHWKDLPIYKHNGLPVETNVSYQGLFRQLKTNRFDYFHRGVLEIWPEWHLHRQTLTVLNGLALFYPIPTYFFVSKNNPELVPIIEKGLSIALKDGSYRALFMKFLESDIKKADLSNKTLIALQNPNLPADTPKLDMSWWLPKQHQPIIDAEY